jgi:hypothetical protein
VLNQDRSLEDDHLRLVPLDPDEHLLPGAVDWDDYLVIGGSPGPATAGGHTVAALSPVAVLFAVCCFLVVGTSALYPSDFNLVPFDRDGLPLFDCPLI